MKILFFFMETIFQSKVHGGSTVMLKKIALSLGQRGDRVTIICRQRSDNKEVFKLHSNVTVMPVLKFKEVFPDAYSTSPYYIASAIDQVYSLSRKNDIFINFDSNFIFNDLLDKNTPLINCLHDFVYSGALQGTFLFRRGLIIVNSIFIRDCIIGTVGRLFPEITERIIVIQNGIDTKLFKKVKPYKIYRYISLKKGGPVILCPHRPEVGKGLFETIEVVYKLKNKYGMKDLQVLIPRASDEKFSKDVRLLYRDLGKLLEKYSLKNNVVFHDWLPQNLMNEYYSLGNTTLCLGNHIESFGNVALESILCGTPAIVTRVGAHRTILPDWCVTKVDPGDLNEIVKQVNILVQRQDNLSKQIAYIKKVFGEDSMIKAYHLIIDKKIINKPLRFAVSKVSNINFQHLSLAPWCYISKKGIYNDYLRTYRDNDKFVSFIKKTINPFAVTDAKKSGFRPERIYQELENGYLVDLKSSLKKN